MTNLLDALDQDPIPPDAIDQLAEQMAGDHHRDRGRQALADEVGVHRRTVNRWISGDSPCEGAQAKVVRMVAREVLG